MSPDIQEAADCTLAWERSSTESCEPDQFAKERQQVFNMREMRLNRTKLHSVLVDGAKRGAIFPQAVREQPGNRLGDVIYLPLKALALVPWIVAGARAEARQITVTRQVLEFAQWPSAFDGLTVAFLSDLHCSPETPPAFLARVVEETNHLKPDLILFGGDYVSHGTVFLKPMTKVLRNLNAPYGSFGVLGNHGYRVGRDVVRSAANHEGRLSQTRNENRHYVI
jgi:hypothetical protein